MKISHPSHPHKLVLKSANCPYYCLECDQLGFGLSYTCSKSDCNFFLHEQCGNPQNLVEYPFSEKCVLKFRTQAPSSNSSLCDVCGKKVKGFHYRCVCTFVKRNLQPFCLSYQKTIKAANGLTLYLSKVAPTKCLHCRTRDLRLRVGGWAYVSSCGTYCYHYSCVMEILNNNWKNGFFTGKFDPFQSIKQVFPSDIDRIQVALRKKGKQTVMTLKMASTVLCMIFNVVTGNHLGLIGAAQSYSVDQVSSSTEKGPNAVCTQIICMSICSVFVSSHSRPRDF